MNYIKIINWFWEEVPYMNGYKANHAALFFAILDAINKNNWAENTPVGYDRLISKVKVCKQVYLDSRNWLVTKGIIEVIPGQNAYHMATFNLGLVVRNQTAILTANLTAIQTADLTGIRTGKLTQVLNNKPETSKRINNKPETPASPASVVEIPFTDLFKKQWAEWKDYKKKEFRFNYRSSQSEQSALNDIIKKSGNNEEIAIKIIEQSKANGWKGFFELKKTANGHTTNNYKNGSNIKGSGLASLGAEFIGELSEYQS